MGGKMSKAKERYANPPKLERDKETGKPKITKAEKKSSDVAASVDGPLEGAHGNAMQKLHMKHSKERMEMTQKHEREHLALLHKGMGKEGSKAEEASESPAEAEKEGD